SSKDLSLFLSLNVEQSFMLAQRIVFGISCALHIPALFCLLWKTPPHQAQIKPNLVAVQVRATASSVLMVTFCDGCYPKLHNFVLVKNIYLKSTSNEYVQGLLMFATTALGIATLTCIVIRHQTMMPDSSRWKMRKRTKRIIVSLFIFSFFAPTITFTVFPFDFDESEKLINESRFELDWVRSRGGSYFRFPDIAFIHVIDWAAITCLAACMVTVTMPFWHMFYVLKQQDIGQNLIFN
ncbi:hypothetical protein PMAYCL1PPCAC_20076, partial [Pristionchus mayeri]